MIEEQYLKSLLLDKIPVSIYLMNGIKLSGIIASFDAVAILLNDNKHTVDQLVYKHAISTIMPSRAF